MIMKRLFILAAVIAALLPGRLSAQAPEPSGSSMPFSMSAGLSLGLMDGAGVNLGFGITDKLGARVGYGLIPSFLIKEYGIDLPAWGGNPAASTAVTAKLPGSGNLLVDFHPTGGSFRVTAGLFFSSSDFVKVYNTKALPDSYHQAGIAYWINETTTDNADRYRIKSDAKGIVSAAFKSGAVKPFIGVGFGSAVPKNRVGVAFDLGIEYTGGFDLQADAFNRKDELETLSLTAGGLKRTVKEIRTNKDDTSYDKYFDYVDKLRSLPVLPVARLSVFVKLF